MDRGKVQFEEEYRVPTLVQPTGPKMVHFIMRYSAGMIKDEKQATYALLGLILAMIIVAAILVAKSGSTPVTPEPIPAEYKSRHLNEYPISI